MEDMWWVSVLPNFLSTCTEPKIRVLSSSMSERDHHDREGIMAFEVMIRSMRSFALITSNTKSGRLSRSAFRNNRRTKHGQEEDEQLQLVPSTLSTEDRI
ncbi:hypothetical protein AVEN_169313-1 [Araneus ventricosus]|uniref:Uncharacterized protein n=1 Tax=Araneus ventricosus TaxID=182803 RepID=A0A4Y2SN05_ARAVE|nr:hypothetical protein AVEN_169313-1 [Araneus ventricosus]